MRINYVLNEDNVIMSWKAFPLDEGEPTIDIDDPEDIDLGIDRIVDGRLVKDAEKRAEADARIRAFERIAELKALLAETDYKVNKFIEGELSEEEFAPIKAQRHEWRAEINELEEISD